MLVVGFLFIVMARFFVYGSGWVFVLMMVDIVFVYGGGWVFCLMVVDGLYVNGGGWIFCSLWWLGFCFGFHSICFLLS